MESIVLCASVTAYKPLMKVAHQLEGMGHKALVPDLAEKMERENNFELGADEGAAKTRAIKNHFKKIAESEVVLVVNEQKHGLSGYIGPNVLMEMAVAFYLGKPIYLLNQPDEKLSNIEEIRAMGVKVLVGDLSDIK